MLGALDAVKSFKLGLNRAALEFGILRTTLKDRVAGRVVHGTRSGPKPYLTPQEEKELAEFLISYLFEDGIWEDKGRSPKDCGNYCQKRELKWMVVFQMDGGVIS